MLSTIGKTIGFLVPFFIAAWFGVSSETDAFFFAYTIILFFAGVFAPVVESVIVPFIAEYNTQHKDIKSFIGKISAWGTIGMLLVSVLVLLACLVILPFITKFDTKSLKLIFILLAETVPLAVFMINTSIFAGTLNANKKFQFPALSPAFRAIINIIIIFSFKNVLGVHSIAIGYVVGELCRAIILFFIVSKVLSGYPSFSLNLNEDIKSFGKVAAYQIIGAAILGFTPIINRVMASWLTYGSISILYYAERLYIIPTTILTTGFTVVLLAHWSRKVHSEGIERLKTESERLSVLITIISVSAVVALTIFIEPIVRIFLYHGNFESSNIEKVTVVLQCMLVGLVPNMLAIIYLQGLLANKQTKTIMLCGIYRCIINIVGNVILMHFYGIAGIALSGTICTLFNYLYFRRAFYKVRGASDEAEKL